MLVLVVLVAPVAACGDDDGGDGAAPTSAPGAPATSFVWETALDRDGDGYVLTVSGLVGDDHAAYELQVEPLVPEGGAEGADVLGGLAGIAVNGFDDVDGLPTSSGPVDLDGRTEVRVRGEERWYRNPWLLEEAAFALGDAEWVRVPSDEPVIADVVTAVLNERYDDALRRLLDAVEAGTSVEAPTPDEEASELDEILTPWLGLVGSAYPIGAQATATGDAEQGEVTWRQVLEPERDGASGEMRGRVEWDTTTADVPSAPAVSIDVPDLTADLAG